MRLNYRKIGKLVGFGAGTIGDFAYLSSRRDVSEVDGLVGLGIIVLGYVIGGSIGIYLDYRRNMRHRR